MGYNLVLTRDPLDPDPSMKALRTTSPAFAVVALTGVALAWVAGRHRTGPPDGMGAAGNPPALAGENDPVLRRVAVKQEVAAALMRGEIELAEAGDRFREVNAHNPAPFALLREQYPNAGDDELGFRQVLHFVRWTGGSSPALLAVRLAQLETEFFTRYPASDPFPVWFRTERPSSPAGADGQTPVSTSRVGRG